MGSISVNLLDQALQALSAFLQEDRAETESFVLIGGSALLALGIISRTTRDADIIARVDVRSGLVDPRPLSQALQSAARRVARELDLDEDWLNTGPADQLAAGLPPGFAERLTERRYGTHLTVYLPGRIDLIHLKLFAAVDHGVQGGMSTLWRPCRQTMRNCSLRRCGWSRRIPGRYFPRSSGVH